MQRGSPAPLDGLPAPRPSFPSGGDVRRFGTFLFAMGLLVAASATASAQRRVTGRVTDSTGTPIPAATISVQGTTLGALTNAEGQYTVNNVPNGQHTLV